MNQFTQLVELGNQKRVFVDLRGHDRIREHSPDFINYGLENVIVDNVVQFGEKADPKTISERIDDLDREWDVDRATMAVFAVLGGFFVFQGLRKRDRRWFFPLAVQTPFLAWHAVKGWCPPVAVLRRLGFRSNKEIAAEKYALKTLRGDFQDPQKLN